MNTWIAVVNVIAAVTGITAFVYVLMKHRAVEARYSEREAELRTQMAAANQASRTEQQLLDAFRSLAGETMAEQSEQLLRLAETRYQGLEASAEARWGTQGEIVMRKLTEYSEHLQRLETERREDSGTLRSSVESLRQANEHIRDEAGRLASALRNNSVRGMWGEMQLRRTLEVSGMMPHVDFLEQSSHSTADMAGRPDVVVTLPNDRRVVIDAKAPLSSYLRATDCAESDERDGHFANHAKAVANHAGILAKRRYEEMVEGSVDFVVMYLPGDAFLSAALSARPELLEETFEQRVILATPSTLIAFLRGVAMGWRERQMAEEAETVARLGQELHERVTVFAEHFVALGGSLGGAVGAYNKALGSMETRLLVTARRFEDLGCASGRTVPTVCMLDESPRPAGAGELLGTARIQGSAPTLSGNGHTSQEA